MSESVSTATKRAQWRTHTSDLQVFVLVEKWMAAIREMSGEPAGLVEALIESPRRGRE